MTEPEKEFFIVLINNLPTIVDEKYYTYNNICLKTNIDTLYVNIFVYIYIFSLLLNKEDKKKIFEEKERTQEKTIK